MLHNYSLLTLTPVENFPLTINSTPGTNYFIKFDSPRTNSTVIAFFVHGGIPVRAFMPVGEFILKSASGQNWCGEHALFGFDTTINEAGRIVRFDYDTEHTIRITPMRDGNLPVKHIPLGKF
jgi:hypothetical protein